MRLPAEPRSYWVESAPSPRYPSLDGEVEADVAVLGAGIAGVVTAYELVRAGHRVALVEADRVVQGVSGHTTAKVTSLHGSRYAHLLRRVGVDGARAYARDQEEALCYVASTAEALRVDCDLERWPAFTYTEQAGRAALLQAEASAARAAGLRATYVRTCGLPYEIAGAVRVEDQLQLHPRKWLLPLVAAVAQAPGCHVFERSRATGVREGRPCRVQVAGGGRMVARDVVVATHYPILDRALLFPRLDPTRELAVTAEVDAAADPGGMFVTADQRHRSVRTAPLADGRRLLVVSGESFRPGAAGVSERFDRLAGWAVQRFGVLDVAHRWAAQDLSTLWTACPTSGACTPRRAMPGSRPASASGA